MRIAQIAPLAIRVPPEKYGGTERVVHALTEELVKRGHEVTLFASGDSITSAKLNSVFPTSIRNSKIRPVYGFNAPLMHSISRAYVMEKEFDVIHDHVAFPGPSIGAALAEKSTTPAVLTLHGHIEPDHISTYREFRKMNIVTISQDLGRDIQDLNLAGFVHNGLPMEHYPFSAQHDGYLLWVGRICLEKGPHHAIVAAKRLNLPLILAGKIEETEAGQRYYRKYVKPFLNDQIKWIGEIDETERNDLMARALVFLHPITWREPFGLTIIEANACGLPVVAFNLGAMPEIIEEGKTGFLVKNLDEMVEAIKNVDTIDRAYCRAHALTKFNAAKMAEGYEAIYKKVIDAAKKK